MKIPILNLYYLISYASGIFNPDHKEVTVGLDDGYSIADLYSRLMITGIDGLLKRGLYRQYVKVEDEIYGIKSRVIFSESIRRQSFRHGKSVCAFDNLSDDILPNQIIKAALRRLIKVEKLDKDIKKQLVFTIRKLSHISDINLSYLSFRKLVLHRNMSRYRILLFISKLIFEQSSVTEDGDNVQFLDLEQDESKFAKLFEAFVRNFYHTEQSVFKSGKTKLGWSFVSDDGSNFLPQMETDIPLESENRIIIIDTKYYASSLRENQYGQAKINSGNMYQMYAYMQHYPNPLNKKTVGILLYPKVDSHLNLLTRSFVNPSQEMHFKTIDLYVPWPKIRADLLEIVRE